MYASASTLTKARHHYGAKPSVFMSLSVLTKRLIVHRFYYVLRPPRVVRFVFPDDRAVLPRRFHSSSTAFVSSRLCCRSCQTGLCRRATQQGTQPQSTPKARCVLSGSLRTPALNGDGSSIASGFEVGSARNVFLPATRPSPSANLPKRC